MAESLFVDGISEITVSAGVVRIEFFALSVDRSAPTKPGEPPKMQTTHSLTVAMPLPGFAASLTSVDQIKQRLIDSGAMKKAAE